MANDKELEFVPDGEPVGSPNNGSGEPPGFFLSDSTIWLIGLFLFIVPFIIVVCNKSDWGSTFGAMDLFLTYVGFLVSPFCAAATKLKRCALKQFFIASIIVLGATYISLFCVFYRDENINDALKIINTISLILTTLISLAVYIVIYSQNRKNKKTN